MINFAPRLPYYQQQSRSRRTSVHTRPDSRTQESLLTAFVTIVLLPWCVTRHRISLDVGNRRGGIICQVLPVIHPQTTTRFCGDVRQHEETTKSRSIRLARFERQHNNRLRLDSKRGSTGLLTNERSSDGEIVPFLS